MIDIKISGCFGCPFHYSDFNGESVGYDTLDICILSHFNRNKEFIVRAYDSYKDYEDCVDEDGDQKKDIKFIDITPVWCPLKKESINIKFEKNV